MSCRRIMPEVRSVTGTVKTVEQFLVRYRRSVALYFGALCVAILLVPARAQTPQLPNDHRRPTIEERKNYEKRMMTIHPARPGCFEAHFPEENWVETKCLPPPRTPNPHHQGARPNTVGAGNDWFATVTSGNISQVTGSFDKVSGVVKLLGPIGGDTSVVHPNVYAMQMNSNTYTPSVCGSLTDCAWVQFIFSQTQCGSTPCAFIEYWLLNHNSSCPSTPSGSPAWQYYGPGVTGYTPGTTPGCYLNVYGAGMSAVPLSDLGGLRVIGKTQGGNDTVTASDASGTLSSVTNPSISDLASGWTGVEYNLVGDCCSTETFFTSTTTASLTLRVATVNGKTDAPNCASTFTGTTAESNNLNLTGGCTPVSGGDPAIVFTESGGGALPPGVSVGDPHLTTIHGAHYNFQYSGEFILVESDPDLQVQVRQALITPPSKPAIAVNTGAAVKMGNVKFVATFKGVAVNGSPRTIENDHGIELDGGVTVVHRGSMYTVSRPSGDIVHISLLDPYVDVTVQLGATNDSTVRGLLVGNPADENHPLVGRDKKPIKGTVTKVALQNFVESWRVEPKESLFGDEDRPKPSGPVDALTTKGLDKAKAEQARKICVERGVKEETALDDCILDVSVMGKPEVANAFVFASKPKQVIHEH
jgi:hypothetical protein